LHVAGLVRLRVESSYKSIVADTLITRLNATIAESPAPYLWRRQAPPSYTSSSPRHAPTPHPNLPIATTQGTKETFLTSHNRCSESLARWSRWSINEVVLRRARLLLGWVTLCWQESHHGL